MHPIPEYRVNPIWNPINIIDKVQYNFAQTSRQANAMTDTHDATLIGTSPELAAVLRAARLVAMTDVPVLIQGESGTGKELLASRVHADSPRRDGPLITVNCAALPETLAESLLYGHRRGAFTGAVNDQPGYIVQAHGGTLFLDEIGELPLAVQAKLLRFLESGEYQPVGHSGCLRADVRVIAATNRDLAGEVSAGRFREDLFYRLNVVPLALPPLRERDGDIVELLHYHTARAAPLSHRAGCRTLQSRHAALQHPGAQATARLCVAGQCARAAQSLRTSGDFVRWTRDRTR